MLHRDERKSKAAKYQQEWNQDNPEYHKKHKQQWWAEHPGYQQEWRAQNPEKVTEYPKGWADGHEKTAAVRQDPSFKKRKGEVLYVAGAINLLTAVPTNMGKIPDTNYV